MKTLKGKLILSYVLVSLLIVVALSVLFNLSIDAIFEQYAKVRQKQQVNEIITRIDQQFIVESGLYNISGLEVIANAALQNGIMVHVRTNNNEIDWDVRQHKYQECQILLQHAETNMHSRYPNFRGGYTEDTYDLKYMGNQVGYLIVGYYGPYSLGQNELQLMGMLNRTLLLLGLIFLAAAVLLGIMMAKRISAPIASVIKTSKEIAEGSYGTKSAESSKTQETADLIASVNEMSQALAQKEHQKKQITADVAHELRTPLFNLQGNMEAMIDQVLEPTPQRLQKCHDEILRLTKIVEQLQDLNMVESGHSDLKKTCFDFTQMCESLFSDFETAAKMKEIRLNRKIECSAIVYGDVYRIKQCMTNLLSNAINYSPVGGVVTVEYEKMLEGVILRVCDTGTGIPPDELPNVFERFYRTDKSRNHANGGMGLGLSITKAIVEAHGGTILAESKPGAGSVFSITLPDKA